jgi:hypothetical protein
MNKFASFCFFVIFGSFLFGCTSQIRAQANALTITVPAVMTADHGIQEAEPKAQPRPTWLDKCLAKGFRFNSWLTLEQTPKLDLETMKIVSHDLKFQVKGNDGVILSGSGNMITWRYQRLGRIVGQIEVSNPNLPTLEAMHDFSYEVNQIAKEYAQGKSFTELAWSRPADSNVWSSSTTAMIITMTQPHGLRWQLVVDPDYENEKVAARLLSESKNQPSLNSVSIDYNLSEIQKLGHKLFAPNFRGVLTFRPKYVELLYEENAGEYSNVCFHVT